MEKNKAENNEADRARYDIFDHMHDYKGDERRQHSAENLHRRMDIQDQMLKEIHDRLLTHMAEDAKYKQALEDMVTLWRASKLIVPIAIALVAFAVWVKQHVRI